MTDPISDMITRIRNAVSAKHTRVDMPASKLKAEIARILQDEGYIQGFSLVEEPAEKPGGAARQAMGGRTRTLTSVMTPQYAPIEQYASDGKQGPWSDIYSAGAVLYRAIAGEPPPEAASRRSPR